MPTKEKWFTMTGLPVTAVDLQLSFLLKKTQNNLNQSTKQKAKVWTKGTTREQEDK